MAELDVATKERWTEHVAIGGNAEEEGLSYK